MTSLFCIIAVRRPEPGSMFVWHCGLASPRSRVTTMHRLRCNASGLLIGRAPALSLEGILFYRARRRVAVRLVTNVEGESEFCYLEMELASLLSAVMEAHSRLRGTETVAACRWIASTLRATRGFTTRVSVWSMSFKYVRTFSQFVESCQARFSLRVFPFVAFSFILLNYMYVQFYTTGSPYFLCTVI